jgi:hypothetical protein
MGGRDAGYGWSWVKVCRAARVDSFLHHMYDTVTDYITLLLGARKAVCMMCVAAL